MRKKKVKLLIVTVGRLDWNIWKPILKKIKKNKKIDLKILATGMHYEPKYGNSYKEIYEDGFKVDFKIKQNFGDSSPKGISYQFSNYVTQFSKILKKIKIDYVFLIGDRFESLAISTACIPFKIPIIHFHGGEISRGSIDDVHRNMLTKSSHIHFVCHSTYRKRVIQMGEDPSKVFCLGSPSAYFLKSYKSKIKKKELYKLFKIKNNKNLILFFFNIETLNYEKSENQIVSCLETIKMRKNENYLISSSNFDTFSNKVQKKIRMYVKKNKNIFLVNSLGRYFYDAMFHASLMIGNSSSGIIEAPSMNLPVINIGERQKGRLKSKNIIDCGYKRKNLNKIIDKILKNKKKVKIKNLYYNQNFKNLNKILGRIFLINKDKLVKKKFYDQIK